jgi:NhaP-type Na+/H+ or K+/H+ antiporter
MATPWFLIVGLLLLGVVLVGSHLRRLPLSTAMLYLAAGCSFGPQGVGLIEMEPIRQGPLQRVPTNPQ